MLENKQSHGRGRAITRLALAGVLLIFLGCKVSYHLRPVSADDSPTRDVVGRLVDPQGELVHGAQLKVYINGGEEPTAVEEGATMVVLGQAAEEDAERAFAADSLLKFAEEIEAETGIETRIVG